MTSDGQYLGVIKCMLVVVGYYKLVSTETTLHQD